MQKNLTKFQLIDYRNFLITYDNKQRCEEIVSEFLYPLKDRLLEYYSQQSISRKIKKKTTDFQQISFGEFLAEHESEELLGG